MTTSRTIAYEHCLWAMHRGLKPWDVAASVGFTSKPTLSWHQAYRVVECAHRFAAGGGPRPLSTQERTMGKKVVHKFFGERHAVRWRRGVDPRGISLGNGAGLSDCIAHQQRFHLQKECSA